MIGRQLQEISLNGRLDKDQVASVTLALVLRLEGFQGDDLKQQLVEVCIACRFVWVIRQLLSEEEMTELLTVQFD
jgi:hypothetical protein